MCRCCLPAPTRACFMLAFGVAAGTPVAIADIPATGRRFPGLTQPQVLSALRYSLGPAPQGPPYDRHAPLRPVPPSLLPSSVQDRAPSPPTSSSSLSARCDASGSPQRAAQHGGSRGGSAVAAAGLAGAGSAAAAAEKAELDAWVTRVLCDSTLRRSYLARFKGSRQTFQYAHATLLVAL